MRPYTRLIVAIVAFLLAGCVSTSPVTSRLLPMPTVTTARMFNPASYPTIGVYVEDLSGGRLQPGTIRLIEDAFMRQILANGYALAARSDIEKVIREQRLQASGVTEETIARVGRVLNVPAIILVSINSLTSERTRPPSIYDPKMQYYQLGVTMSARLIAAERAEVLWLSSYGEDWKAASQRGHPQDQWPRVLQHVADVVARGLPPRR